MKAIKSLGAVILLFGILLSACAPTAASKAPANVGAGKAVADVTFTGVIENINGNEWVINRKTIQVDSSVVRDGSFQIGDTVTVEAAVAKDGSVTAQRVETPSAAASVEDSASTPEVSIEVSGTSSMPDLNASPLPITFDNGNNTEAVGTVDAITDTSITIDGQTFTLTQGVEIKGDITAGAIVKLHFTVNADGTLSVTEIEIADSTQVGDDNGNDDNSNGSVSDDGPNHDANDDNGNDGSNHDANDDNGGGGKDGGGDDSGGNSGHG